jgi:hypothetical protein
MVLVCIINLINYLRFTDLQKFTFINNARFKSVDTLTYNAEMTTVTGESAVFSQVAGG